MSELNATMSMPLHPARCLLPLVAVVTLAGCIHMPFYTANLPASDLRRASEFDICAAYASTESNRLRAEINRRNLIQPSEWEMVAEHRIAEGMSACALLATLGFPADRTEDDDTSFAEDPASRLIYMDELSVITHRIEVRGGVAVRVER